jgi:lipoate-protein ligase A
MSDFAESVFLHYGDACMHEITYSVIAQEEDFGTKDVFQICNTISEGLIQAAKILGVSADFAPGNLRNCPNVAIKGKKISGNAQFHRRNVVLQHGTFLLDVNFEKMFTLLWVPSVKTHQDAVWKIQEKITAIRKELGKEVSTREAYQALIKGFAKVFVRQLKKGRLTMYEQILAQQLREDKFSTEEWNLKGRFNPKPKHL